MTVERDQRNDQRFWCAVLDAIRSPARSIDSETPAAPTAALDVDQVIDSVLSEFAEQVGPACVEVVAALNDQGVMFKLRQAQGILGLRERHDAGRLEAACRKAIEAGDPSYRTIKGILTAGVETEPAPPGAGDGGAAAHLHGPVRLFANVIPLASTSGPNPVGPATTSDEQQHGPTVA